MTDERRQVFEFAELQLIYTCPNKECQMEFSIGIEKRVNKENDWRKCPRCQDELVKLDRNNSDEAADRLLWDAVSTYRTLQKLVKDRDLPLRLYYSTPTTPKVTPAGTADQPGA